MISSPSEKSGMPNKFSSKTGIIISGAAVIALALMLFVNAMSGRDVGQSNLLLVCAFALLTGLALVLLFIILRTARTGTGVPVPEEPRAPEKAATKNAQAPGTVVPDASGEIISDTAGELRTSVDAIQEELEEILDDEAPADKEHMQSLCEETDRLKKIIDSMDQLAHAQAMARVHKKEPVQVRPLLNSVIEKIRLAVTDRDITYTLECDAELAMKGDPECIGLIIENITDNAARAIKGSGSVTLTAARRDRLMVFSVKDTGIGIRRAQLSHIYERYFRGTGSGIGMGLFIVKELVDAFGGKIEVRTAAGKGTTVTVQMPGE
jgi:signal transduction histidine kinase